MLKHFEHKCDALLLLHLYLYYSFISFSFFIFRCGTKFTFEHKLLENQADLRWGNVQGVSWSIIITLGWWSSAASMYALIGIPLPDSRHFKLFYG